MSTVIAASPQRVWADVRDISTHVEWMADAAAITFTSSRHEGVGTRFDCLTKIGPIALQDRMVVTEWTDGKLIGLRHEGVVRGTGRMTVKRKGRHATKFTWTEKLQFPFWLGGTPGAWIASPILRLVWRRNLRKLRSRFE